MIPGDTIRVLTDRPNFAEVYKGACGTVTEVHPDGGIRASFAGTSWMFEPKDVEVVDVAGAFLDLMGLLQHGDDAPILFGEISDLYDEATPAEGVPVESTEAPHSTVPEAPPQEHDACTHDDPDDDDDEDVHANCPDEPHAHTSDGEMVPLPHLLLTDGDGDRMTATDVREVTADLDSKVALALRLDRPSGLTVEVHLTEAQTADLARFLLKRYPA